MPIGSALLHYSQTQLYNNTVVSTYSLDGATFSANGAVGSETGEELELVGGGVVPVTAQEPHVDASVIGCPPEGIVHYWPVPGAVHTVYSWGGIYIIIYNSVSVCITVVTKRTELIIWVYSILSNKAMYTPHEGGRW